MCEACGCSAPGHDHHHDHDHHHHDHDHHHHDHGHTHTHETKTITLDQDVLAKNNAYAEKNRQKIKEKGLFAINLISSPGSGKTTLLEALGRHFGQSMAVIEGDIQTSRDADRVVRSGSRAHQIETNGACHLDAHVVGHAMDHIDLSECRLLVIENVGNLVCPAAYDLGEHEKMAILSLPEGDDKILKYPALFSRIQALVINKIDLQPYLDFNVNAAINECKSLNRTFETFVLSARTGEGMDHFIDYIENRINSIS